MRVTVTAFAALAAASAWACSDPTAGEQRFAAVLHGRSTRGEPLADVRFWADGRNLGATDARGVLRVELRGREGSTVELTAACPVAHRAVQPTRKLGLRTITREPNGPPSALELTADCEPLERTVALVVLADGPLVSGLPLRVDGEVLGQTDPFGAAHLLVTGAPRSTVRVELDTSNVPALRPRSPIHSFNLGDEDGILLLEQPFTVERRVPRAAPKPAPPPPAPRRPQRIQ